MTTNTYLGINQIGVAMFASWLLLQHQLLCHSVKDCREKEHCPLYNVVICVHTAQVAPLVHTTSRSFWAAICYFHQAYVVAKTFPYSYM